MLKDMIHFYRVESLDAVRAFYGDILKFNLYKDQKQCLIYDAHGIGKIGFCLHFPKDPVNQSCITLVYETKEAVDDMYQHLVDHGMKPEKPAVNETFGIYHFFMRDPNQLWVECQAFL